MSASARPSGQVAVLTATRHRVELIARRALAATARQTVAPAVHVIVNDGDKSDHAVLESLGTALPWPVVVLGPTEGIGAAAAWNLGLRWLWHEHPVDWVAILDDDDEWDSDHIDANLQAAHTAKACFSVSGLRLTIAGEVRRRPLIERLAPGDFLIGNPGWQGSNTFVRLDLLCDVGGFRPELRSLNDRDLAIRILRHPGACGVLVPRFTATWHADTPGALSAAGGAAKLQGLRGFWEIYGYEMTVDQQHLFFERASRLFGIHPQQIAPR